MNALFGAWICMGGMLPSDDLYKAWMVCTQQNSQEITQPKMCAAPPHISYYLNIPLCKEDMWKSNGVVPRR